MTAAPPRQGWMNTCTRRSDQSINARHPSIKPVIHITESRSWRRSRGRLQGVRGVLAVHASDRRLPDSSRCGGTIPLFPPPSPSASSRPPSIQRCVRAGRLGTSTGRERTNRPKQCRERGTHGCSGGDELTADSCKACEKASCSGQSTSNSSSSSIARAQWRSIVSARVRSPTYTAKWFDRDLNLLSCRSAAMFSESDRSFGQLHTPPRERGRRPEMWILLAPYSPAGAGRRVGDTSFAPTSMQLAGLMPRPKGIDPDYFAYYCIKHCCDRNA